MIERKILCRIALTRAPETQTRPYFFQKIFSIFVNFDPRGLCSKGAFPGSRSLCGAPGGKLFAQYVFVSADPPPPLNPLPPSPPILFVLIVHMGASLLSLCPESGVGGYRPEKKEIPINPVRERIEYKQDQLGFIYFPAGRPPTPSAGWIFGAVLGGGVNSDKI